jgi:Ca2+-binding EF-hand superfamily protein
MTKTQWTLRSLAIVAAAGLALASPAGAQTSKPSATNETPKPATTAPARAEDNAAEFDKLDKNKDGFIDKGEAMMEPKLLTKWADIDTNKDGKISKDEYLAYERKEHPATKQ